ncbi:hypothetical protein D3C75_650060 [compost metagenome]
MIFKVLNIACKHFLDVHRNQEFQNHVWFEKLWVVQCVKNLEESRSVQILKHCGCGDTSFRVDTHQSLERWILEDVEGVVTAENISWRQDDLAKTVAFGA